MGLDKNFAIKKKYRVPEMTLLTISFIGGCFGSVLGMFLFHHKTKKWKFRILIPLSIIVNLFVLYYLLK